MARFPPLPLDRFSPRAQRLLEAAWRRKVVRSPVKIARRLRACGRPVFEAVLELERTLGGLSWGPEGSSNDLGIVYSPPGRGVGAGPAGDR